jgi:hypothetical protein
MSCAPLNSASGFEPPIRRPRPPASTAAIK